MSGNDPQSDADKIRAKRLAALNRLGGSGAASGSGSSSSATNASTSTSTPSTSQPIPSTAGESSSPANRPASALDRLSLGTQRSETPSSSSTQDKTKSSAPKPIAASSSLKLPPASNTAPSASSLNSVKSFGTTNYLASSIASGSTSTTVTAAAQKETPKVAYADYESGKILEILGITLQNPQPPLRYLPDIAEEAKSSGKVGANGKIKVDREMLDELIIASLSLEPGTATGGGGGEVGDGGETVFEYLAGCWKRLYGANRDFRRIAYSEADQQSWKSTWDKLKDLIISYSGHTLEDPTMFPQPANRPTGPAEFVPLLLSSVPLSSSPYSSTSTSTLSFIPKSTRPHPLSANDVPGFLNDLAARFTGDGLEDIIQSVLSFLFQSWYKIQPPPNLMGEEWKAYLGAIGILVQVKPIAAKLPSLAVWFQSSATPEQIEWFSLLGPLTRLSTFPREYPAIHQNLFRDSENRPKDDIKAIKGTLGSSLAMLQDALFNVYNAIVRASPASREGMLDFFGMVVKRNVKRSGMQVDHRTVASDGYMMNLQAMLLRLFEPVMDATYSKIDRIDVDYYRHNPRVDIKEDTKIKATAEEANEYYSAENMQTEPSSSSSPFISDLFFLLQAYQHLGINKTLDNRTKSDKKVRDYKKHVKKLETEKGALPADSPEIPRYDVAIKRAKADVDNLMGSINAYDAALLDKDVMQRNIAFLCYSMQWLVRLVDPRHAHPNQMISLPLPEESPQRFRMLPEYVVENISDYLEFVVKNSPPSTFEKSDKDTIITFMLTFLSPGYVNNPFLKAKFMSMLAIGVQPWGYFRKGIFYENLIYHPLATEHLMPTLIRFFIDVEMTGGHTQFWDKFNFRRDIENIFRALWDNQDHRAAFVKARHDDLDNFTRFINMLMSDTTFHLDESLTGLAKIHSIRSDMENPDIWNSKDENEKKDMESQLSQAMGNVPFHTMQGRSHVKLMEDFTKTTKEPFLTGEIVERLAATLDENLSVMVGPKMQELKVSDPEKFDFKPKELLASITQIYINLGESPEFIRAVANDGRSYSRTTFERLIRVLKNRAIMVDNEIEAVVAFLGKVEEAKATIEIEDEREIPDEFLDPLMATLMRNPVILPVSRVTVDQATIRAVLLSNNKDPFNNVPLKFEDCVPDVELKKKIDAWVAEGKGPSDSEVVSMDVDEIVKKGD